MRKKTNTWSNNDGDSFTDACEGDETCLAWLDAREQGYTGSLDQYKKNQGKTNGGWDIGQWVSTGSNVLGSLSDLFGKGKGGNSTPPPPPAPTKSYTAWWIAGGLVAATIIGVIVWKSNKE